MVVTVIFVSVIIVFGACGRYYYRFGVCAARSHRAVCPVETSWEWQMRINIFKPGQRLY